MPDRDLLVDEVGLSGLLGDRVDGSLEDLALTPGHCRDASPRVLSTATRASVRFKELGEAPQRAAAAGLPRTRLTKKGSSHDRMEVGLPTESAD